MDRPGDPRAANDRSAESPALDGDMGAYAAGFEELPSTQQHRFVIGRYVPHHTDRPVPCNGTNCSVKSAAADLLIAL